jgi:hypothetical protein
LDGNVSTLDRVDLGVIEGASKSAEENPKSAAGIVDDVVEDAFDDFAQRSSRIDW